ncbi:hypothetical protein AB5I41_20780 [Sphingomonas sp. MMS24-JH45]
MQRIEPPVAPDVPETTARRRRTVLRILGHALAAIFAVVRGWSMTKGRFLKSPFESIAGRLTNCTVSVGGDFQLYFVALHPVRRGGLPPVLDPAGRASRTCSAPIGSTRESRLCRCSSGGGGSTASTRTARPTSSWNVGHDRNTLTFSEEKGRASRSNSRASIARRWRGPACATSTRKMRLLADLKVDTIRSTDARIGQAVGVNGGGVSRRDAVHGDGAAEIPRRHRGARARNAADDEGGGEHDRRHGTLPSIAGTSRTCRWRRGRGVRTCRRCSASSASPFPTRAIIACARNW